MGLQVKEDLIKKEDVLERKRKYKIFLIGTKFIPHLIALMYIIYTFLNILGIDALPIGYIFSLTLLPGAYIYSTSIVFEYCYVHRLPLYYVLINEIITTLDYYFHIPISDFNLLVVHILLVGILIMGYTIYYLTKIK